MAVATRVNGYTLRHETLQEMRFVAVRMIRRGIRAEDIAESMRLNRSTVFGWIRRYRLQGWGALKSTKAPGAQPKLKPKQFIGLIRLLRDPATQHGFGSDLWTGPRVRSLIHRKFRVRLHPKHMPRFLRRLGLVRRSPERRALEQDPKAVRRWRQHVLPGILRSATQCRGIVLYGDESLFALIPHIGKTWTFPEVKPVARVSAQRGIHVGVTSAVSRHGHLLFQFSKSNFNAHTLIRFMTALHRHFTVRKLFFIIDGARPHRARAVQEFAQRNAAWLSLHPLPSYSPELNPDEEVWNVIKTRRLNARPLRDKRQLHDAVMRSLRSLQKHPQEIRGFFKEEST